MPSVFVCIKLVGISAVIEFIIASEDHDSVTKHSWLMVRNFTRESALPLESNRLPLNTVLWISHQLMHSRNAQPPHVVHRAFFKLSTSMHVKTKEMLMLTNHLKIE